MGQGKEGRKETRKGDQNKAINRLKISFFHRETGVEEGRFSGEKIGRGYLRG